LRQRDEHLNKVGTGDGEERHVGLAGHSTRQQGLAGSRGPDEKHTLGNASTELLELLRLAQVFDDLLQLFLGFVHAGHVFERDFLLLHAEQARAALAERERLVAADCICRIMKNQKPTISTIGAALINNGIRMLFCGSLMSKTTLLARSSLVRLSTLLVEMWCGTYPSVP